jgi:hypothetical protein
MANINISRGKYVTELKEGYSIFKEVLAPQLGVAGEKDLGGARFSLGWSYLSEPFLMVADAHRHDFDQVILFFGGDPNKIGGFDAEVELGLGDHGERTLITYPACVYIPGGVIHGPLNVKRVTKPFMFIDITLSTGYSVRPVPPGSERT